MKENQHNIFNVPIWGFIVNEYQYQNFDYKEKILSLAETTSGVKKSNFGGYQTKDTLHQTEPIFKELVSLIEGLGNSILKSYNCLPCEIKEMWANVNYNQNYNGSHIHSGILSGVFYCQVPPDSGRLVLCNPAVRADVHLLKPQNFPITPQPLSLIIFPSWLEHYVEPNQSQEPRISISFNIDVK